MTLRVFTLRERPELRPVIFGNFGPSIWPEYMLHDPVASLYFSEPYLDQYLDYILIGVEGDAVVARGFSVPFAFNVPGREELPDGGWDEVIRWAHEDVSVHRQPTAVSALGIELLPEGRSQGNSRRMIEAMKANARVRGFADLFAPVRPNREAPPTIHTNERLFGPSACRWFAARRVVAHTRAPRRTNREDRALCYDDRR